MILVTGGSGFVGQMLIPALLRHGHRVSVLTRDPGRLTGRQTPCEIRCGDLLDRLSLHTALRGVSTIVHLAAVLPDSDVPADTFRRVNVEGTRNLARAARECGVAHFVHASSAGVYGDGATLGLRDESSPVAPRTLYEQTKLEGERTVVTELSHTSVSWTILRPAGVHGPGRLASARLFRRIRRQAVWIHGPTTVMVHPTYVGDVVSAVLLTVGRTDLGAQIVNIAGPLALTYRALIDLLASRLGVRVHQLQVPVRATRAVACAGVAVTRVFGQPPPTLERLTRPVLNRTLDITKARRLLGFEPHPLETGIDETIAWARRERLL
jgi:dihydroflavonol-4-reductase